MTMAYCLEADLFSEKYYSCFLSPMTNLFIPFAFPLLYFLLSLHAELK